MKRKRTNTQTAILLRQLIADTTNDPFVRQDLDGLYLLLDNRWAVELARQVRDFVVEWRSPHRTQSQVFRSMFRRAVELVREGQHQVYRIKKHK